jgi:Zn-dependent M28 family amino/carboxypeptidase
MAVDSPAAAGESRAALVRGLRADVEALAVVIGVRDGEHPHEQKAAVQYIGCALESIGAGPAALQSYEVEGRTHYNVCFEVRGTNEPEQVVVVGAHYDTARGTPGADDNASGVAGMIALARRICASEVRPTRTVRFVAFGTEEPPHIRTPNMGSYHYARACRQRNDNIVAMLSLDMIGYFSDAPDSQRAPVKDSYPTVANFIAFAGHSDDRSLIVGAQQTFNQAAPMSAEIMVVPAMIARRAPMPLGANSSDQWSFWQWGYPGIMATDTANWRNQNYHMPGDTADTLDYERMAVVVEGLEAVVRGWAGAAETRPAP